MLFYFGCFVARLFFANSLRFLCFASKVSRKSLARWLRLPCATVCFLTDHRATWTHRFPNKALRRPARRLPSRKKRGALSESLVSMSFQRSHSTSLAFAPVKPITCVTKSGLTQQAKLFVPGMEKSRNPCPCGGRGPPPSGTSGTAATDAR